MKLFFATVAAGLCSASLAGAALPPFHDSAWMIQTILQDEAVEAAVEGGAVTGIELIDRDALIWRLSTQQCSVTLRLVAQPMPVKDGVPMVGRVDYAVTEVSGCTAK